MPDKTKRYLLNIWGNSNSCGHLLNNDRRASRHYGLTPLLIELLHKKDKDMKCDRCKETIEQGEERELHGQTLCEDCYMDALSPARMCDPWAVHSAKSLSKAGGGNLEINETQAKILRILKETGGAEPRIISERLQLRPSDLEREIAALRHMEKVRGELREGKRIIRLW
ncbi:MAG: hypothetical protein J7M30_05695 [Deltaproteobacteria bacterium]|nr:hypothetical protein [Deltaproteobacteria bacterium]